MTQQTQLAGYYTTAQAANLLGYLCSSNLAADCRTGRIAGAIKVGKTWLIPAAWVDLKSAEEAKPQGNRGVRRK